MKTLSLKTRLRLLLGIAFVIPLFLLWVFTSSQVNRLYRENTNVLIQWELSQIKGNMDVLMDSLKYISQQIATDEQIDKNLRTVLNSQSTEVDQVNALQYIREQLTVYEASNPNISNITLFTQDPDGGLRKINSSSLLSTRLPGEELRLTTQNVITYYGPHTTGSRVSDYSVISLSRKMTVPAAPDVLMHIESGFRQLDDISSRILDSLGAVYTVLSDTGSVIYTSDEERIPRFQTLPASSDFRDPGRYQTYQETGWSGWSLQVFVPTRSYNLYLYAMSKGFIISGLAAVILGILAAGIIWRTVYKPLRLFEQNLQNIANNDLEANIRTIHVREFDQNFEYFERTKERIESLIQLAQRQEQERSRLEIRQLFSKMNPHFINNTLDTLRWYAEDKGYRDVYDFLSAFNRLLMYNMEKNRVTTLQSELDAVSDYILLQKMKYDIEYETKIALPAPMLQSEMPRFILQPLVENAILHGLEGRGRITLSAGLTPAGKIRICIANGGLPLDVEKMEEILRSAKDLSSNGIGIQYVVQMLEARFPGAYEFNVSVENGENLVEIVIPFSKGEYYAKDFDR